MNKNLTKEIFGDIIHKLTDNDYNVRLNGTERILYDLHYFAFIEKYNTILKRMPYDFRYPRTIFIPPLNNLMMVLKYNLDFYE